MSKRKSGDVVSPTRGTAELKHAARRNGELALHHLGTNRHFPSPQSNRMYIIFFCASEPKVTDAVASQFAKVPTRAFAHVCGF